MAGPIIVSIIIPTYNNHDELNNALCSIEKIDYPAENFEVIVVDDGSNDDTGAYVADFMDKSKFSLVYVYQENRGPAAARNVGIHKAKGDYILIIDSDCYVDKNIIKVYLNHFPCDGLAGVGGNVLPLKHNYVSKYLDYRSVWRPGYSKDGIAYLVTANAFFCKKALLAVAGFDEDFRFPGGEEPEMCYRLRKMGYFFRYEKNAVVVHAHRTNLRNMIKMFKTHGEGLRIGAEKWDELKEANKLFISHLFGKSLLRFFVKTFKTLDFFSAGCFTALEYVRILSFYYGFYHKRPKVSSQDNSSCLLHP